MKYFRLTVIALFLCSISVFSQENNIKHAIVKGETISSIAQKYNVSIASIYKLNPNAKKTLQLNQVLLIPNSESKKMNDLETANSEKTIEINHQVLTKETLYGITKQFKTTTELLYKANPKLEAEGLKVGQTIIIPSTLTKKEIANLSNSKTQEVVETAVAQTIPLTHEVEPKESLYVIAKMYGVSLKELQSANPKIGKKGLSIGQTIEIPSNGKIAEKEVVIEGKNTEIKEVAENKETVPVAETVVKAKDVKTDSQIQTSEIIHEVLTKETKYGIAKKYGITVAELEKQNQAIQQKLLVGSKLTIQVPTDKIEIATKTEVVETKVIEVKDEAQAEKKVEIVNASVSGENSNLIDQIIEFASDKIGTRYRSGGTSTAGFDCSGLMYTAFGAFDIKLPRSSIEQSSIGEKIDDENAQKGDLIFFKTNGRRHINHVGVVIEVAEDEIKFIHSSTHSGVIVSSTKEPYYQRNFAQVNRVVK
ncbi:LysM peptidoglycan-binding domain-containing protein [Flavobacterium granuli]|uniref:Cell wall-associated NlpC family hydrolase n=1 Tax=Flavobacterium granuli TaxID=280093 RepID=A0ABU1RYJ7_9FLAO|nr:LysM peptidoglycan-binding domain-containing protein [Flavobacterium granuli]MDR6843838.1 cell wall-associated NlpC family hydrolase [Flavobacterium granuli]